MAIDGVKIIDSDDGHDIYNLIVERYRDGISIDTIISEILGEEQNFCTDEFYTEIYWTAVAYSLWKLAPAGTLEDIYEEITDNPRLGKLRLIDTYELVKEVIQK